MKIFGIILFSFFSLYIQAKELKFECISPESKNINRFDLKGSIEIDEDQEVTLLEGLELSVKTKKRGINQESQEQTIEFSGTARYIDSIYVGRPFYALKLKDTDKEGHLLYLNLSFPRRTNSSAKLKDGYAYRSHCKAFL